MPPPVERLWTSAEVAEYLSISVSSLYQLTWKGTGPPGFKVGRHDRYRRQDVDAWLEANATRAGAL